MKKIIFSLIMLGLVFTSYAKNWQIIGEAMEADTTELKQNEDNPKLYTYIGYIKDKPFKLFDGTDYYIPVCGMDDPFDQTIDMEKQVDMSQQPFRVHYVNKNTIYRITVTDDRIPKIMAEKVIPLPAVYLIGGPVNTHDPNWLLTDVRELEKDPENPFVFYYRGFLIYNTFGDERGAIKFLTSRGAWDPAYHPAGTSNVPLAEASTMRLGGADTKWEIPADGSGNGYYVIKLNTLDETISVEEFIPSDIDYPSKIFIAGDAMPSGWDNQYPEEMLPTNIFEGKYAWTGNVVAGDFKFLKTRGSWGNCYVSTIENQPIEIGEFYPIVFELDYISLGGNDYKFIFTEPGRYTINIDLDNMHIMVEDETQSATDNLNSYDDVLVTSRNGKMVFSSNSSGKKHYSVFTIEGSMVQSNSFVHHAELTMPKGYYIIKIIDSNNRNLIKKMLL